MLLLSVTLLYSIVVGILGNCPEDHCESDQTCCLTLSGAYECCSLPNATCCSNGKGCCPEGMECGIEECILKLTVPQPSILEKRQLATEPVPEEDSTDIITTTTEGYAARLNLCNRRSYCPNAYACCIEPSGDYNCCPPNSICCSNSGHCCPEGTQCDLDLGTCRPGHPFSKRQGLIENYDMNEANINRCDKKFYCPDEYSCCKQPNGEYGCCPYPNAVCCSDRLHCCQEGEKCDGTSEMCYRDDMVLPQSDLEKAVPFLTDDDELHV